MASDMNEIQSNVFFTGFGPMPLYRRSSVTVLYNEEHDDGNEIIITSKVGCRSIFSAGGADTPTQQVSCIVPHSVDVKGCRHAAHQNCYFCPHNPFYELLVDSTKPTIRYSPSHVSEL